jgi:hypothetical protein
MTILECENCGYKFPSKEVELKNIEITKEYFRIKWNCLKCNTEGTTLFINNRTTEEEEEEEEEGEKEELQ